MEVDPNTALHRAEHEGHPYYFCSAGCRTKFISNPAAYLA
jgi:Cu+-exporting ATPase